MTFAVGLRRDEHARHPWRQVGALYQVLGNETRGPDRLVFSEESERLRNAVLT